MIRLEPLGWIHSGINELRNRPALKMSGLIEAKPAEGVRDFREIPNGKNAFVTLATALN
ncbi:MAG: hypothetical protein AAFN42_03020 [Cyanobacteria bacterium J06554_1]